MSRTLATDHVGPYLCLVRAFFKTPRPRPDRPKVGADVEFGTLNRSAQSSCKIVTVIQKTGLPYLVVADYYAFIARAYSLLMFIIAGLIQNVEEIAITVPILTTL